MDGVDRIGEIKDFLEKGTMLCDILPRVHLEFNSNIKEPLHRFYSVQNMGFIT